MQVYNYATVIGACIKTMLKITWHFKNRISIPLASNDDRYFYLWEIILSSVELCLVFSHVSWFNRNYLLNFSGILFRLLLALKHILYWHGPGRTKTKKQLLFVLVPPRWRRLLRVGWRVNVSGVRFSVRVRFSEAIFIRSLHAFILPQDVPRPTFKCSADRQIDRQTEIFYRQKESHYRLICHRNERDKWHVYTS